MGRQFLADGVVKLGYRFTDDLVQYSKHLKTYLSHTMDKDA